jgi:hypothetical protein
MKGGQHCNSVQPASRAMKKLWGIIAAGCLCFPAAGGGGGGALTAHLVQMEGLLGLHS